jgi:hypothetical protein
VAAEASSGVENATISSQKELAELAKAWPAERLVAIFNSLTGVTPVESFKSNKAAVARVWQRIQGLGDAAQPEPEAEKPESAPEKRKGAKKATGRAQGAKGAPAKGRATKKATPAKAAPKAKKPAKAQETSAPREGSKMAQVIAMLQRKNGATLDALASTFKWERHTVRGMIAGALKKAGYKVESFKSDKGERTYRINQ